MPCACSNEHAKSKEHLSSYQRYTNQSPFCFRYRGTNLLDCVSNWLRDLVRPIVSVEGGLRTVRQLPSVKYWMKFEPKTNLAQDISRITCQAFQVIGMFVIVLVLFLQFPLWDEPRTKPRLAELTTDWDCCHPSSRKCRFNHRRRPELFPRAEQFKPYLCKYVDQNG